MAPILEKLQKIPAKQKYFLLGVLFVLSGYLYFFFLIQPVYEKHQGLETEHNALAEQISSKESIVNEIRKGKKEITLLKQNLEIALTKLPDQKEIPGLLTSISEAGKGLGLEFLLFEPSPPVQKEFYAEIPAKVSVVGSYSRTVQFFEKIARLPRIVNITDVQIVDSKTKGESPTLNTSCTVQTYMFVEKSEKDSKKDAKKDSKKDDKKDDKK